ncbi:hypothetical protein QYE76_066855 [Lolium multiflorum]|uniref:Retrotransposon gag domain-containing protein n=1 Tax=Lolium multiflorum TaxID=4521 RepID=A0AAD8SDT2_LOLMU|nr:hypothetical protein QYE76_066855 [Lolium multiflorum]
MGQMMRTSLPHYYLRHYQLKMNLLYEEETSIARGGEEQLDVKMGVKLDMELDMKISHGRAREEREACARGEEVQAGPTRDHKIVNQENKDSADIINWREFEALRNEMRREFRAQDDELKGTVDEIKQTLDATNATVTGLADQVTDIQRNIADMLIAIENLTAQQQQQDDDEDPELEDDAHNARGAPRGHRPRGWVPLGRNGRGQDEEDGLGKPKFSIPKFEGGADVEEYLTWELKIEKLWSLHPNYSEDKKIKLASSEFDGYALRWWDSLVRNRDEDGAQPIRTWRAMKEVMTSRFVPTNYMRNIFDKLTLLRQGVKTVDEYYMEMEMLMQRGRVRESLEMTMQRFLNGLKSNVDPNNVPLASLVAQEENVDVNFIKNNNFNNNAYRNNSGNNYRPYPSANGNGYGNSYGNSYNNNRSVPSGLEVMLKEFISTQTAFNKSVEEKLDKIDIIASRVDRLASDVNLLKLKVMPNDDIDNKITTTANAIQVRINENIRLMAELRARWDREENEKLAKENNVAKVWTITTTSNANSSHVAAPPTINGKIIGVGNVSTPSAKRTKLPEIAKTAETACDKTAEIFSNLGNNDPIAVAHNDLDFDDCHISEVIKFLQKLAKSPNASAINLAFTKHITNALIKAREEKLKLETSIPRKLEDGWEPIIKMKFNDFECNALCDLGASISVMPKKIYDMLDLPPLKNCYLDVNLADNVKKKPLGRIDNVRITVNNNLVPVDFVVLDIECNASCPIVLGRPFLRTVGAVIDMREGNIKYQFPLKKGMEHFPRKRMKLPFDSIIRTSYDVDASTLDVT